jgi:predicted anti-sigma-YlaC factor YlaD
MNCDEWQVAISAQADGEDTEIDARLIAAHLAACGPCRQFRDSIDHYATDAATAAIAGDAADISDMPDLSRRIVRANAIADRARVWWVVRFGLLLIAAFVIYDASRDVFFGAAGESAHAAKHLGSFTLAYGVGLAVVAVRPARARTMLPVTFVLGGALMITAIVDVLDGETPLLREAVHIPELLSVLLVWLLVLPVGVRPAPRLVAVAPTARTGGPTSRRAGRSATTRMRDRPTG